MGSGTVYKKTARKDGRRIVLYKRVRVIRFHSIVAVRWGNTAQSIRLADVSGKGDHENRSALHDIFVVTVTHLLDAYPAPLLPRKHCFGGLAFCDDAI